MYFCGNIFSEKSIEKMNKRVLLVLLYSAVCGGMLAENRIEDNLNTLHEWKAGDVVSAESVRCFGGIERCFATMEIPDAVWAKMQGKSYKENKYIKRDDLRYLKILHVDKDQKIHLGEMICNKHIADILLRIFRQLYDANYPIERMVLPDEYDADDELQMRDNNTSCFCYRVVARSATLSYHARGLAVDLNPLYNPYYKKKPDGTVFVQPKTAAPYIDRTKSFPYKIDVQDLAYRLFIQNGFTWGGGWRNSKDYQHFEYKL